MTRLKMKKCIYYRSEGLNKEVGEDYKNRQKMISTCLECTKLPAFFSPKPVFPRPYTIFEIIPKVFHLCPFSPLYPPVQLFPPGFPPPKYPVPIFGAYPTFAGRQAIKNIYYGTRNK
jgi:hypothetical protein